MTSKDRPTTPKPPVDVLPEAPRVTHRRGTATELTTMPYPWRRRLAELLCVLIGHDWTVYGSSWEITGEVLVEYNECGRCGLQNRDESGMVRAFKRRYGGAP